MAQRKPVVMSSDNKRHNPLADGDKLEAKSIPLSSGSGNLLEVRDDGLYYGIQAPADISNLYVDSTGGLDTNAGTKAAPLKTIAAALSKVRADQSNTIHLRAGRRYAWPNGNVTAGATRTFRVWDDPFIDGDKVPTATPEKTSYNGYLRAALNRPVVYLDFVYNEQIHVYSNKVITATNGGVVQVNGLRFEAKGINQPGSGSEPADFTTAWGIWEGMSFFSGDAAGVVQLLGCEFDMYYRPDIYGEGNKAAWRYIAEAYTWGRGAPSITFTSCSHVNAARGDTDLGTPLVQVAPANMQINVTNPGDSWSQEPGYEYLNFNIHTIPRDAIASDITRDANGVPRNLMSNLVF